MSLSCHILIICQKYQKECDKVPAFKRVTIRWGAIQLLHLLIDYRVDCGNIEEQHLIHTGAGVATFELSHEGQMGVGQVERKGMVMGSSREGVTGKKTSMYKTRQVREHGVGV